MLSTKRQPVCVKKVMGVIQPLEKLAFASAYTKQLPCENDRKSKRILLILSFGLLPQRKLALLQGASQCQWAVTRIDAFGDRLQLHCHTLHDISTLEIVISFLSFP